MDEHGLYDGEDGCFFSAGSVSCGGEGSTDFADEFSSDEGGFIDKFLEFCGDAAEVDRRS
jgi:hypothetical protein